MAKASGLERAKPRSWRAPRYLHPPYVHSGSDSVCNVTRTLPFISVNFQIGSLNPYIPETRSNIPGNLSMDNQSRSSFWQGLFKHRECEKKKEEKERKENLPKQIIYISPRGPQMAASWLPQPSSLSASPSSIFASQSVSVSPALGLAQVHFRTCLLNSYCRQDIVN